MRKYVALDLYVGLKFRSNKPSLLSGDDDEEEEEEKEEDEVEEVRGRGKDCKEQKLGGAGGSNSKGGMRGKGKDRWTYAFGGDVSLRKLEPKSYIKVKGKSKNLKKLYPIMMLTKIDHGPNKVNDNASPGPPSWITFATESKNDLRKWVAALRKCRDLTQYMRACR